MACVTRLEAAREAVLAAARAAFEPGALSGRVRAWLNAAYELVEAERAERCERATLPALPVDDEEEPTRPRLPAPPAGGA